MHSFDAGPRIYFGEEALSGLCDIPRGKVLVVADPFMVQSGMMDLVTNHLDCRVNPHSVFSEIEPDPSLDSVITGMQFLFSEKPEVVVALGGGSAIDVTKAMLFFYLRYKMSLIDEGSVHRPCFVAIPTTSGSGTEVTSYSVVTDKQRNRKIPLSDPDMLPDRAILEASFLKTLPKNTIAFTGMDVITHAVEASVARGATTLSDLYAVKALQGAFVYLPLLYEDTSCRHTCEEMLLASCLAGVAFNNAGLGLNHAIAHTLGAAFRIPHGKANAMVAPYVIAYNAGIGRYTQEENIRERYLALSKHLEGVIREPEEGAEGLIRTIRQLCDAFGIPSSLRAEGVDESEFLAKKEDCVAGILQDPSLTANPLAVSEEEAGRILTDVFEGNLVW